MKTDDKIDRFCYTHPRFGIHLGAVIVIGNAAVWLLTKMDTTGRISRSGRLGAGHPARAVAACDVMFHAMIGPIWLLVMLYFYYWIGSCLEREWGNGKFTIYYVSGMLLTAIYGVVLSAILGRDVIVSTTYLNLSMFFAFATLYPDMQVLLFFIIPIKVKYLAYVDAALFVLGIITTAFPLNLLPVVAVLNYLVYCGDWLFDFFRPSHVRQRQKTVNFKREARRIQREQANKPYHYKCANLHSRYRHRLSGALGSLLLALRGLSLLLSGPHQQPCPFHGVTGHADCGDEKRLCRRGARPGGQRHGAGALGRAGGGARTGRGASAVSAGAAH